LDVFDLVCIQKGYHFLPLFLETVFLVTYARVVEEKVRADMQMLKKRLMEKRAGLRGSM
jgi:hypothetical protein